MTTAERPMLFSAPMVQALIAGRKTQTRRVAKPRGQTSLLALEEDGSDFWADSYVLDPGNAEWLARSAPAHVGETMYVREAFRVSRAFDDLKPSDVHPDNTVHYEADPGPRPEKAGKLRPGIHMPRWASRIERTVVSVRLERLNDCSPEDAKAEGLEWVAPTYGIPGVAACWHGDPRAAYAALWDYINGAGAWDLNPRVWVIEFSPS